MLVILMILTEELKNIMKIKEQNLQEALWKLIFHRKFLSKSAAMSYEYKLKKDKIKRKKIIKKK